MLFIAVDGVDGSGKTTLARQLADLLAEYNPLVTKEPTADSEWGKKLRKSAQNGRLPREVELQYFHLDRLDHIKRVIQPALNEGRVVICDRYVDSTLAFQASSIEEADELYERFKPEILIPDVTFILRCPVNVSLGRIRRDRDEVSVYEKSATLNKAAKIYESRHGDNYIQLLAGGKINDTFDQAASHLKERFPKLSSIIEANRYQVMAKDYGAVPPDGSSTPSSNSARKATGR
jgi:dTMP kinase